MEAGRDQRARRDQGHAARQAEAQGRPADHRAVHEGVTLELQSGSLVVHNGLQPKRDITIRAEADTVMNLSNLKIGPFGMPVYYDEVGRGIALKLVRGRLRIEGLIGHLATLNTVTRIFPVK